MPPSAATNQYPPCGRAVMPTIGWFSRMAPVDPAKRASPNEKMPPSDPTSQYPWPLGVGAIPTMGALSGRLAALPLNGASP
jgi:hypothetical protein